MATHGSREAAAAGNVVECDVGGAPADVVTIDVLARMHLRARRGGYELRIVNASSDLVELVALMGLAQVLHS